MGTYYVIFVAQEKLPTGVGTPYLESVPRRVRYFPFYLWFEYDYMGKAVNEEPIFG